MSMLQLETLVQLVMNTRPPSNNKPYFLKDNYFRMQTRSVSLSIPVVVLGSMRQPRFVFIKFSSGEFMAD